MKEHYILLFFLKKRLYGLNFHNYPSKINWGEIDTGKTLIIFHC